MSKPVKYIAFDTETGGLDPTKNPILTAYFAAVNEKLEVVDELDMKIKPEEPFTLLTEEAMKVNKIDMEKHLADPNILTRDQAREKLVAFIKKHGSKRDRGADRPKPFGHNVDFDVKMLQAQILPQAEWDKILHYHRADTMTNTVFLKDIGWLPDELGKLESLVKYFNVPQRAAHNAREDTLMAIDVHVKMIEMMSSIKNNANSPQIDLLSMLEK